MQRTDSEQVGCVFDKTNPNLTFKRHYKKILSDSNCYKPIARNSNIFDPEDDQAKMLMEAKPVNPEEIPLGGRKYFEQIRRRIEQTGQSYSNMILSGENRKRQRTLISVVKQSNPDASKLLSDLKNKTLEEEYKSHSKTHASISKPTTTQYSRNFYKPTTTEGSQKSVNRLSCMYQKMEKQYFRKLGMLGEIEFRQPLIKRYGDRYFEYMMRDRYKDEDKSSYAYLYQLKPGNTNEQTELEASAIKQGIKFCQPSYMQLVGVNKRAKERYSSCAK